MTVEPISTDIGGMPELARLAHEVARTGKPHILRENGTEVAVLSPVRPRRRSRKPASKHELEAVLSATFGAWKGLVDPDEFKRQRRDLQRDDREPRTL